MRFDYDTSYRDGKRLLRHPSQKLAYALLALVLLLATVSEGFAPTPAAIVSAFGLLISIGLVVLTTMVESGRLA